jgi:polyisoprenyl-phosphate glycosyltransferase
MSAERTLIIVPVFNDVRSLSILLQELAQHLSDRQATSVLVVDDGSLPAVAISDVAGSGVGRGQLITLSRNFGHQRAIAIGLAYAVARDLADIFVIMDADGEDKPGDVPRLRAALDSQSEMSIVVAKRTKRSERLVFKAFYQLYRLIFFVLTGHRISFGNFSAMSASAARRLVAMSELWVSLPATLLRSRLPLVQLPTERGRRYRDNPRMNVQSLVTLGFGAISAFLESVLTRMILAAAGLAALFMLASVAAAILKIAGMATPGWVTTVVGVSMILMLGVVILSFIGLTLSILAGAHTIPAPNALYESFIVRTSKF